MVLVERRRGDDRVDHQLVMNPEHRDGVEFRVSGRSLSGRVLVYGDVAPDFLERFVPGSLAPVPAVALNLQHDSRTVLLDAGEFVLNDTERALEIRAELPVGSAAFELVRRGALSGFSIEFHALRERREAGIRVIDNALLTGIALVDHGAYPQSKAEVRRRGGGGGRGGGRGSRGGRLATFRGRVPVGKRLDCRCSPGDCTEALFDDGAFDSLTEKQVSERGKDILAVVGNYSQAIGSAKRGNVRYWQGKDGSLEFAIDVPATDRGRALVDTFDVADVYARPVIDVPGSTFTREGTLAKYSEANVRAFTLGPTDANEGWTALRLADDLDDEFAPATSTQDKIAALSNLSKRRARLWL